jgi:hypothetical protein
MSVTALLNRICDAYLGPRDHSVIDDGTGDRCPGFEVYAVLSSRVVDADIVLASGLRRRAAGRLAERVLQERGVQRG